MIKYVDYINRTLKRRSSYQLLLQGKMLKLPPCSQYFCKMYKHLTAGQRYKISALLKAKHTITFIAMQLGVSKSTISREVKRNQTAKGAYSSVIADEYARLRQMDKIRPRTICREQIEFVREKTQQDWSPEQIVGFARINNLKCPSHEWIYQYIYKDKLQGGELHTHLRTQRSKRRRKQGKNRSYTAVQNRVFIHDRPPEVELKQHVEHWEMDTIFGKRAKQAIVTLVERKSMFTCAIKVPSKNAEIVKKAIINTLAPFKEKVKTITTDNASEFAKHQEIAKKLNCKIFFTDPYSAWQKGLIENTNKLIRQYIPKNANFTEVSSQQIWNACLKLNARPRKNLNFKTPNQIFFTNFAEPSVALKG